jgi:hypothetical protein
MSLKVVFGGWGNPGKIFQPVNLFWSNAMLFEMLLIKWGVLAEVAKGFFQFPFLKGFDLNGRL